MPEVEFSDGGVTLRLSKEEWWFMSSAVSYVLHWRRLPDREFPTILMMDVKDAERLERQLNEAEVRARAAGQHWSPIAADGRAS